MKIINFLANWIRVNIVIRLWEVEHLIRLMIVKMIKSMNTQAIQFSSQIILRRTLPEIIPCPEIQTIVHFKIIMIWMNQPLKKQVVLPV